MDLLSLRKRITGTTYLNFKSGDFKSIAYKDLVQSIILDYYFTSPTGKFDISILDTSFNPTNFIKHIGKLRTTYKDKYLDLYNYTAGGQFGPGEIVSYFLTKNGILSGRSASGDLNIGSESIEIKAANISKLNGKDVAYDLRTGAAVFNINDIYSEIAKLARQHSIPISREIPKSTMDKLRAADSEGFTKIEEDYKSLVFNNYFNKYGLIIFNNRTSEKGDVVLALKRGQLSKDKISLNRLTQNSFTCNIEL